MNLSTMKQLKTSYRVFQINTMTVATLNIDEGMVFDVFVLVCLSVTKQCTSSNSSNRAMTVTGVNKKTCKKVVERQRFGTQFGLAKTLKT